MSTDNFALVASGLCKRFGNVIALEGLSLGVLSGEIYGLLGPNGAGKTTALRIVCGLTAPDSGDGQCLGRAFGDAAASLGYLPQRGGLYDDLTVTQNLMFFARAHGLSGPRQQVARTIADHGLAARSAAKVGTLSGGWRQRVALAAALLHAPKLLLLDEPTAGLDPTAREQLWPHMKKMRDRIGAERGWPPMARAEYEREIAQGSLYVGSPETVAQKIAATARGLGLSRFDLKYSAGGLSQARMLRCIALYGEAVMPRVRALLGQG